jgi:ABC-2 type transport system ATP-binding protein
MIEMEGLVKTYGSTTAVRDLTLSVPAGELFCFLGPNGAGKTTTIKILTGLVKPTAGRARIADMDIHTHSVEIKRVVGYIPDMPYLYDRLTPVEFLEFTASLYGIPPAVLRDEGERLLHVFGMNEYRSALIRDLSHGYRQRLIYTATLLHNPRVLFIDEPLIGLDPHTIRLIKDLLIGRARAGMTIFLTTHILALAEDIADRIGIIMDGRLAALGTLDELRTRFGAETLEEAFLSLTGNPENTNGPR